MDVLINISRIKTKTEEHYRSEGKEEYFNERIEHFKKDIVSEFSVFKSNNPDQGFQDYKESAMCSVFNSISNVEIALLPVGLFLIALDKITEEDLK